MQGRRVRRTHRLNSTSSTLQGYGSRRAAFESLEERRLLAGVPELLKDINATTASSGPDVIGVYRGEAYFTTSSGQLWKSDGTLEGTVFVADVGTRFASDGAVYNDRLYFATSGVAFHQLWATDGTAAGTVVVRESPTSENWSPSYLQSTSHSLLFVAKDSVHGDELWTSDGTAAGTQMVKDISPGPADSLDEFILVGDTAYFSANDGSHGWELWRSDGTDAGTVLVADIRDGSGSSSPGLFTEVDGRLYFRATDENSNSWLWKSDGTSAGTERVKQIKIGSTVNFNGELYFAGGSSNLNLELWKSDGTSEGTVLVKDINPTGGSKPVMFKAHNDLLYFQATSSDHVGLWQSDGTEIGTALVADLGLATDIWIAAPWATVGDGMLFVSADYLQSRSIWRVEDGVVSLVKEFSRGLMGLNQGIDLGVDDIRVFVTDDGTYGSEAWRTDGTAQGTYLLKDINSTPTASNSNTGDFIATGDTTFFLADDGWHGRELWRTDGILSGTVLVKDLTPGTRDSYIGNMANVNGILIFEVLYATDDDNSYATGLWRSDGTASGTQLVYDFAIQLFDYSDEIKVIDGVAYFPGRMADGGEQLWRSDGTTDGTWPVTDLSRNGPSHLSSLVDFQGTLYFAIEDSAGASLWKSDGTAAGTALVMDLLPGTSDDNILRVVPAEGRLYLVQAVGATQILWTSDGTEQGTVPLVPMVDYWRSEAIGSQLIFQATDGSTRKSFVTDGTVAGTQAIRTGYVQELTNVDGTVFFTGGGLWKTDGTVEGTALVKASGAGGVRPSYLRNVNGTLLFRSDDALWKSDGTENGTVLVDDSLQVDNLYAVGNTLYIINRDPVIGTEPWVLRVPPQVVGRHLFYNDSSFDGDDAGANAADDGAIAPDKIAHLPGMGLATTASVSSYVHGINGLIIDIVGLEGELTADDFIFRVGTTGSPDTWTLAPAPLEVAMRAGEGVGGSDRVTINWAGGAIKNTWLQVTVKGNDALGEFSTNTGLAESDVFFFGSRVGDSFEGATALATATNARDELAARFAVGVDLAITHVLDFNRDGMVSAADRLIARHNAGILMMIDVDEFADILLEQHSSALSDADDRRAAGGQADLAFALALGDDDSDGEESVSGRWRGRKQ